MCSTAQPGGESCEWKVNFTPSPLLTMDPFSNNVCDKVMPFLTYVGLLGPPCGLMPPPMQGSGPHVELGAPARVPGIHASSWGPNEGPTQASGPPRGLLGPLRRALGAPYRALGADMGSWAPSAGYWGPTLAHGPHITILRTIGRARSDVRVPPVLLSSTSPNLWLRRWTRYSHNCLV